MNNCNYNCNFGCTAIAVIAALIIGTVTAILRFAAVITVAPAFFWVTFGIAVVYQAIALGASVYTRSANGYGCLCENKTLFTVGVLGTILTSLILLAVPFAATSVAGAIITGILLAFFTLLIASAVCITKCSVCANN